MNDFEIAYDKSHKESKVKKWWSKNYKTVMRVILFPIWVGTIISNMYKKHLANRNVWNEDRAKRFCDKYLPIICEKCDNGFYFYNNGYGFTGHKCVRKHKKDYRFAYVYRWELFKYIRDTYEIDGYSKEVHSCEWDEIEVEFIKSIKEDDRP